MTTKNKMSDVWLEVRGYMAAGIALVACPCHLVVTLPLLIALTAGTALGAFLRQNSALIFGVSTVLFVAGLYLALRWMGEPSTAVDTPARRPRPRRRQRPAPAQMAGNGRAVVTLLHAPTCPTCPQAQTVWRGLQDWADFDYEEVDITTKQGRALAARYGIMRTPVTLINGVVAFRGAPSPDEALAAVH